MEEPKTHGTTGTERPRQVKNPGGSPLSPAIDHQHRVVRHQLLRAHINAGIIQRRDAHDVCLTHLLEKIRHELIKPVMTDFNAI